MIGLLDELGKGIADRWFALLVLPGALLVATAALAWTLGDAHWSDVSRIIDEADRLSREISTDGPAGTALALIAVLVLSAAAGLLAQGTAALIRAIWAGGAPPWPGPLAAALQRWRVSRWEAAQQRYAMAELDAVHAHRAGGTDDDAERRRAMWLDRRNRIAYASPVRPTWIADRLAAAGIRVWDQYRLDLVAAWPRLWLTMPDIVRTEVREAASLLEQASTTTAWGLLYLALGARWWPAIVGGVIVLIVGWRRGRAAAALVADLVESAVDIYGVQLARAVGVACAAGTLTPAEGESVSRLLRKGL